MQTVDELTAVEEEIQNLTKALQDKAPPMMVSRCCCPMIQALLGLITLLHDNLVDLGNLGMPQRCQAFLRKLLSASILTPVQIVYLPSFYML